MGSASVNGRDCGFDWIGQYDGETVPFDVHFHIRQGNGRHLSLC